MPAMPPPTTITAGLTGTSMGSSGTLNGRRWICALRMRLAFSVASSLSSVTHEQCSRTLAIWSRNGLRPASAAALRNVGSCIVGEQAATTTRFTPSFWMSSLIRSWPGSSTCTCTRATTTTLGCSAAQAVTFSTSTLPAMLLPQWQK